MICFFVLVNTKLTPELLIDRSHSRNVRRRQQYAPSVVYRLVRITRIKIAFENNAQMVFAAKQRTLVFDDENRKGSSGGNKTGIST